MLAFHAWSERQAHRARWLLLGAWLLLIASMLRPGAAAVAAMELFWQIGVPLVLLVLVVFSHEAWRRLCPLAFVSQLPRALGRQRMVGDGRGRSAVARVASSGWLARHHVRLQWGLFLVGLSLRLLLLNRQPLLLALFLLITLTAALVVGWAWSGKAWCQYVCPMAPVQSILVGPRSLLGSDAHLTPSGQITQSTCRTFGPTGQVQRACVGCQRDCIDIDAELSFWEGLRGKPGLGWAWFSYPGLVIGFLLLQRHGSALTPWTPLLLLLSAWLSVLLCRGLRRWQKRRLEPRLGEAAGQRAEQITRLLASFTAVNAFFALSEPSLPPAPALMPVIRSLVLACSAMWLYRGLRRNKGHYARERISASLRQQLQRLIPDLACHLDGRSLEDLSADEVVTLARVLPAQLGESRLSLYREVVADLLRSGRITRAAALVQLSELRQSLQLADEDHHAVLRELAITEPRLLELDNRRRDLETLRRAAAVEAVADLLALDPHTPPPQLLAQPAQQAALERIRREQGLDDRSWEEILEGFQEGSGASRRWLKQALSQLQIELAGWRAIQEAAAAAGAELLQPLLPVQERRLATQLGALLPLLPALPADDPKHGEVADLLRVMPTRVQRQLGQSVRDLLERAGPADDPLPCPPPPAVEAVLERLWRDPDPDTALWVLWVQEQWHPQGAARLRQTRRAGLPTHPELEALIAGRPLALDGRLHQLLRVPLIAVLPPATLLTMARSGAERRLGPAEPLFRIGEPADLVAILVEGPCEVWRALPSGEQGPVADLKLGDAIGELAFFSGQQRRSEVRGGPGGATLLCFEAHQFETLLLQAPEYGRELSRRLALRLEELYERLGPADHRRPGG
jgi:hypothetical protein